MRTFPQDMPGADLVSKGLEDLAQAVESAEALLVSVGAPRLRAAGLELPRSFPDAEHRLYRLLSEKHGDDTHSQYNALIRRLVSFERALECATR